VKIIGAVLLVVALGSVGLAMLSARAEDDKKATRVFELRTYHVAPGKMKALNERFVKYTNKLLEKHGMTLIGFWTPADPKEAEAKLIYLVGHPSKEAAEKNWKAFGQDPDWKAAKATTEKDGKLVEKVDAVFLNPTDYSALK
jgi:hypothetical protein